MMTFHWADYLLFVLLLLGSAAIGFYYRFVDRVRSSVNDLQLGGRQMTLLPVTFSIMASFMSAISILGTTAEVYINGVQYVMIGLSYFFAFPLAAEVFMPILYRLRVSSAHEYLEMRFSPHVRSVASFIFILQMILYISVVLYAPALAFSQVSGFPMWTAILSTGLVCTAYTALGGIKAVMWTDFLQMCVILFGLILVVILGLVRIGGFGMMWQRNLDGGRLNFDFDPDPLVRHSFWTLLVGGTFMCSSIYCSNQAQLQRYLSCKSERVARVALWLNLPLTFVFLLMLVTGGMVAYAFYHQCDPLLRGNITKADQVVPQLVLELFSGYPGVPGLFLAAIFAAALSTVSTGINSLATVFYEDVLKALVVKKQCCTISEKSGVKWARLFAVLFGLLTIGLAFLASVVTPLVLQIALSIFGMIGGPILAVFSLGMLWPCINEKGALVGFIVSVVINLWIGIGAIVNPWPSAPLPRTVEGCVNATVPSITNTTTVPIIKVPSPPFALYRISYLYFGLISCVVALLVALPISAATGWSTAHPVRRGLLFAPVVRLGSLLPSSWPTQVHYEAAQVDGNEVTEDGSSSRSLIRQTPL